MRRNIDPIDVYVGRRLRGRRINLHMSQTELGKTVGVTFQQVQKYETGKNRISGSRMAKVAQALGVTPAYFFEGAPGVAKGNGGDETAEWLTHPDAHKALQSFVGIKSCRVRTALIELMRALEGK